PHPALSLCGRRVCRCARAWAGRCRARDRALTARPSRLKASVAAALQGCASSREKPTRTTDPPFLSGLNKSIEFRTRPSHLGTPLAGYDLMREKVRGGIEFEGCGLDPSSCGSPTTCHSKMIAVFMSLNS